jgi:adenosylcobinamide-GDP ribazoletransferase
VILRNELAMIRDDFFAAVQFLTRIPTPGFSYRADSLASAAKFFPVVGLILGATAAVVHSVLAPHLPRSITALFVITFLVLLTGGLHEDALADAADGFGGGWNREQVLLIFKDSRIGSHGAAALTLGLVARLGLVASLPLAEVSGVLVGALVLSRWSILPLSFYLPSARAGHSEGGDSGQGARLARMTSLATLIVGSLIALVIVAFVLRRQAVAAIVAALIVTFATGTYYRRRIGGVTGDCFGATVQLVEIVVLLMGVWVV